MASDTQQAAGTYSCHLALTEDLHHWLTSTDQLKGYLQKWTGRSAEADNVPVHLDSLTWDYSIDYQHNNQRIYDCTVNKRTTNR